MKRMLGLIVTLLLCLVAMPCAYGEDSGQVIEQDIFENIYPEAMGDFLPALPDENRPDYLKMAVEDITLEEDERFGKYNRNYVPWGNTIYYPNVNEPYVYMSLEENNQIVITYRSYASSIYMFMKTNLWHIIGSETSYLICEAIDRDIKSVFGYDDQNNVNYDTDQLLGLSKDLGNVRLSYLEDEEGFKAIISYPDDIRIMAYNDYYGDLYESLEMTGAHLYGPLYEAIKDVGGDRGSDVEWFKAVSTYYKKYYPIKAINDWVSSKVTKAGQNYVHMYYDDGSDAIRQVRSLSFKEYVHSNFGSKIINEVYFDRSGAGLTIELGSFEDVGYDFIEKTLDGYFSEEIASSALDIIKGDLEYARQTRKAQGSKHYLMKYLVNRISYDGPLVVSYGYDTNVHLEKIYVQLNRFGLEDVDQKRTIENFNEFSANQDLMLNETFMANYFRKYGVVGEDGCVLRNVNYDGDSQRISYSWDLGMPYLATSSDVYATGRFDDTDSLDIFIDEHQYRFDAIKLAMAKDMLALHIGREDANLIIDTYKIIPRLYPQDPTLSKTYVGVDNSLFVIGDYVVYYDYGQGFVNVKVFMDNDDNTALELAKAFRGFDPNHHAVYYTGY